VYIFKFVRAVDANAIAQARVSIGRLDGYIGVYNTGGDYACFQNGVYDMSKAGAVKITVRRKAAAAGVRVGVRVLPRAGWSKSKEGLSPTIYTIGADGTVTIPLTDFPVARRELNTIKQVSVHSGLKFWRKPLNADGRTVMFDKIELVGTRPADAVQRRVNLWGELYEKLIAPWRSWVVIAFMAGLAYSLLKLHERKNKAQRDSIFTPSFTTTLIVSSVITVFVSFQLSLFYGYLNVLLLPVVLVQYYLIGLAYKYMRFDHARYRLEPAVEGKCWPAVAVLLPTYKEPLDVGRMTLDSVLGQNYRGRVKIIVVDNGAEYKDLQAWEDYVVSMNGHNGIETVFIRRDPSLPGYKPLNIDIGLEQGVFNDPDVDLVLLLDADSTLPPDALRLVVPEFDCDPKLDFVQIRTVPTNGHFNPLACAVAISQNVQRYTLGLQGHGGAPMHYGHNNVVRRSALESAGKFVSYDRRGKNIITEDFELMVRLYQKGRHGKPAWISSGEWVPSSLDATESMWQRWAYGGLQVWFKHFLPMLKAFWSGRITFYAYVTFLMYGGFYLAQGAVPLFVLAGAFFPQNINLPVVLLTYVSVVFIAIGYWKKEEAPRQEPVTVRRIAKLLVSFYSAFIIVSALCI
jgi:cellulose synthase/poly-beta-1,6-N-acetylglucosamine synthase-like glycosyltransferase